MIKYELIPEQLLYEGVISEENLFSPALVSEEDILSVHTGTYWERLKRLELSRAEERRTGFPLSAQLVRREQIIGQGTIECSLYAMEYGLAMNVAGGTHHAFSDRGEGFCLLNDIAMAARFMLRHQYASRVLVIDLDVHQGNGTAEIFRDEPRVFTFSMHGEKNYPYRKETSDLDVALPDATADGEYLDILSTHLPGLFNRVRPDLVYFQSGVDILQSDKLGRLAVTRAGCRERDRMVFNECYSRKVPVVAVMGGGYSPHIRDIVEAHVNTFRLGKEIFY